MMNQLLLHGTKSLMSLRDPYRKKDLLMKFVKKLTQVNICSTNQSRIDFSKKLLYVQIGGNYIMM